ncbi:MAG: DUF1080 domain-containing protein [Bacteroidetes bacterium]|nr:DUF1080 domain-containing protein [Bacteroidota bacterium]MBS1930310.1 DUF1080 domain-containing protein [Bacteroidota bacterium]
MKRNVILLFALTAVINSFAQGDPKATEVWSPVPTIVTPGKICGEAPSDALILFDGKNLDQWESVNDTTQAAGWKVTKGILTVDKTKGNIQTKKKFMDYQLHLEYRIPKDITGSGQERGNSGVFLASTGPGDAGYEIQVLDNYKNETYVNGQAASVYKQYPPLVNACKKPGKWQAYDIVWTAPRFNEDGSLKSPAHVTVFHNGVLVQNNVELKGPTLYIGKPSYKAHGASPIKLQAHGDKSEPLSFRNIWVREL